MIPTGCPIPTGRRRFPVISRSTTSVRTLVPSRQRDAVSLEDNGLALHPSKTAALGSNSTAFLDLMRGLAANLVLVEHTFDIFGRKSHIPFGMIGVSIFFILSGFLIQQSSLARIQRPGPYFAPYMIDRFARIFTAYVPVLI